VAATRFQPRGTNSQPSIILALDQSLVTTTVLPGVDCSPTASATCRIQFLTAFPSCTYITYTTYQSRA